MIGVRSVARSMNRLPDSLIRERRTNTAMITTATPM